MAGFKSFAERTRLEFEPGLIAIVGPNGCGKSNICDAIRWVLGEQSARALRGDGMTDFIFDGTDTRKPMGMAEVSLTLADCDGALGLDYHEVTITRRVHRSGEGEYLINRTPCRLKDIQRLFFDTGIGTNAYSLMEQGRIDLILSSRPEDRREVFEEASGISRCKADRREAMRKLEHTEANLLRLADLLRESKRQIISLQRQAGKARRYQALEQELRRTDLHFVRRKLEALDREREALEARRAALVEREEAIATTIREAEARIEAGRSRLAELERAAEETRELAAQARAERSHAAEMIAHHELRIAEYRRLIEDVQREAQAARARAAEHRQQCASLAEEREAAGRRRQEAQAALAAAEAALAERERDHEAVQREVNRLRAETVELDHRIARLTNELADLEAREKGDLVRRERLRVEQAQLQQALSQMERQRGANASELAVRREALRAAEAELEDLLRRRAEAAAALAQGERERAALEVQVATLSARIEPLRSPEALRSDLPPGARLIAAGEVSAESADVLGPVAGLLEAEPEVRPAMEAALRPWADALVVRTADGARALLAALEVGGHGSARLLAPPTRASSPPEAGRPDAVSLASRLRCPPDLRPAVEAWLEGVYLVPNLTDGAEPPPGVTWVTPAGRLQAGRGAHEWWNPSAADAGPMARRRQLDEMEAERAEAERRRAEAAAATERMRAGMADLDRGIAEARRVLEVARTAAAMAEGEGAVLARQEQEARRRAETVAIELEALSDDDHAVRERREAIHADLAAARQRQGEARARLAEQTDRLRQLEQERAALTRETADARIALADRRREAEALAQRVAALEQRARELEAHAAEREATGESHRRRIEESLCALAAARDSLQPLEDEERLHTGRLTELRRERDEQSLAVQAVETELRHAREALNEIRDRRGRLDVEVAEARMRRQNLADRAVADYRLGSAEEILAAPRPEGADLPPDEDLEAWESRVAELRARLQSMGPVNMVAIEECEQLEKEYEFRVAQQDDLLKSRDQLQDLIRRINQQATEMFRETFNRVNEKFGEMFARLFHGGSARLVLVDEADVLESGIEIVARPPGKKLQSISLLSGGERTMTAVALLFALYAIKPSPFCVLDEMDAALDDSNIGRFVSLVKEFLAKSQFIVITHNRQTIAAADILYGVTMEQRGVSQIVSVKFNRHAPGGRAEVAAVPGAVDPTVTGA